MAFAQPHASSLWLGLGRKSKVMASSLAYLCFWATWLFIEGAHAVVQGSSGSQGEASFPACSCAVQEGEPGGPLGQGQKEEVQGWIWYHKEGWSRADAGVCGCALGHLAGQQSPHKSREKSKLCLSQEHQPGAVPAGVPWGHTCLLGTWRSPDGAVTAPDGHGAPAGVPS